MAVLENTVVVLISLFYFFTKRKQKLKHPLLLVLKSLKHDICDI